MPAEMSKFAESDAYITALIRQVETMPQATALQMGRRGYLK